MSDGLILLSIRPHATSTYWGLILMYSIYITILHTIYMYMYMYAYVCMYVCMYVCIYIYTYIHINTDRLMYIFKYIYVSTSVYIHTYRQVNIYICIHTHTHTHTHIMRRYLDILANVKERADCIARTNRRLLNWQSSERASCVWETWLRRPKA